MNILPKAVVGLFFLLAISSGAKLNLLEAQYGIEVKGDTQSLVFRSESRGDNSPVVNIRIEEYGVRISHSDFESHILVFENDNEPYQVVSGSSLVLLENDAKLLIVMRKNCEKLRFPLWWLRYRTLRRGKAKNLEKFVRGVLPGASYQIALVQYHSTKAEDMSSN